MLQIYLKRPYPFSICLHRPVSEIANFFGTFVFTACWLRFLVGVAPFESVQSYTASATHN
jgi:hypothetical protein